MEMILRTRSFCDYFHKDIYSTCTVLILYLYVHTCNLIYVVCVCVSRNLMKRVYSNRKIEDKVPCIGKALTVRHLVWSPSLQTKPKPRVGPRVETYIYIYIHTDVLTRVEDMNARYTYVTVYVDPFVEDYVGQDIHTMLLLLLLLLLLPLLFDIHEPPEAESK